MAKKDKKTEIQKSVSIRNRKASHEYHFLDKFTAGIVLSGTEIKSIRMGKVNLQDAFCVFVGGELFVRDMHVSPYAMGHQTNHLAKTDRKLLLRKRELRKLEKETETSGVTIIPIHIFINDRGLCKVTVALAKGKKLYDKREDIKAKDTARELQRMKL